MKIDKNKKYLYYNTISSFIFQITTIICGLILPRLILNYYGSNVNGLINSITQFLSLISFLELGVGAVVQSALYRPLSTNDNIEYSKIYCSSKKFFNKLGLILLIYVMILIFFYPMFINNTFNWDFVAFLIAVMSISFFSQYFFGISDKLILNADQKAHIQYNIQTITIILNTVVCFIMIKYNLSIQIVKLSTSIIYLLRPLIIRIYINKKYNIIRNIQYEGEPIKQKWNGMAQHISAIIIDSTDTIILTLFADLSDVSIYSVYFLIINGIRQLLLSLTRGVQSYIGYLWAIQDIEKLKNVFSLFEFLIHNLTILLFGCVCTLIVPFIEIYTLGINDANYIQPLFGVILSIAFCLYCLRNPYNILILAAGEYKKTQKSYIIASIINILVSIIGVLTLGLIGVAIGTLIAMFYQTIWMSLFTSKNILKSNFIHFLKNILLDILIFVIAFIISCNFKIATLNYIAWFIFALKILLIWTLVTCIINLIFNFGKIKKLFFLKKMKQQ